ncbi:MAG: MFS transporter [Alphaproteobacteria bacterium]|nr:MAG: MFS transporter [Alphaproteobacteria bacterium]
MPVSTKLGYGIGIFGPMLGWVAATQYLMYFYTDVAGIDPARAGLIFMLGMVWDAISDPLIGTFADKTRTRWGKYRPYLLFGAVPFALSVFLVFTPYWGSEAGIFWFALITCLLFRTGYTVVYMPYTAMIARMTTSYDVRTSLTAVKTAFVFAGNLVVSFGFYSLVLFFGAGSEARGFPLAALVIGLFGAITTLICFAQTREAPEDGETPAGQLAADRRSNLKALFRVFADLAGNRAFLLLFFGVCLFGGFYGLELAMTAYFAKYWLGDAGHTRTIFTVQALTSLASIPLWLWLAKVHSKTLVWVSGILLATFGLVLVFLLRPTSVEALSALYAVKNAGATGFIMIFYAMTADTVDWGEWVRGRRHEGVIFGAISFANKFSAGVATGVLGLTLSLIGFVANENPSAGVIDGMFVVGTLVPAIGFCLAALLMRWYPVTRDRHAQLIAEVEAR